MENTTAEDFMQIINLYKQKSNDLELQFLILQSQNKNLSVKLRAALADVDSLSKSLDQFEKTEKTLQNKPVSNKVELKSKPSKKATKLTK